MAYIEDISDNFKTDAPINFRNAVQIINGEYCLVEGHRGIIEYSSERICVKIKKGSIAVRGEKLSVSVLTVSELYIRGEIKGVDYEV